MENCPDWVPGDLYIAGAGVAKGYLNDEERTKEKFIIWESTGERLYSTGDMGRYWRDGNIEFLLYLKWRFASEEAEKTMDPSAVVQAAHETFESKK